MHLTQLTIRNFRNLAAVDWELPPDGVVIIGENGHGKTNLLEAIYYLVLFRSLRGARDRELVRFDEAGFFLAGTATSVLVGRALRDIQLAEGCLVAVIRRGGETIVPRGATVIDEGDWLTFIGSSRGIRDLRQRFEVDRPTDGR